MEKLPAETRLGADCGSDHELLIAKFRLKLKKVGKTTRSFRYEINPFQLHTGSDKYIQGVRSDIECLKNCGWRFRNIVEKIVIKTIPKERKYKKAKWLSMEALQITEKREAKGKEEKERYTHLNTEFQKLARRDFKSLSK